MTGCFPTAGGAGVTQIRCHTMRPTVADWFAAEEALGDQGRAWWAVTRVFPSSIVGGCWCCLGCNCFRDDATDILSS